MDNIVKFEQTSNLETLIHTHIYISKIEVLLLQIIHLMCFIKSKGN